MPITNLKINHLNLLIMATFINSIEDLKQAENHVYNTGGFLSDGTNIYAIDDDVKELIESFEDKNQLEYHVNWEDDDLYDDGGTKIEPVYSDKY